MLNDSLGHWLLLLLLACGFSVFGLPRLRRSLSAEQDHAAPAVAPSPAPPRSTAVRKGATRRLMPANHLEGRQETAASAAGMHVMASR